jgi:hypothetical protein
MRRQAEIALQERGWGLGNFRHPEGVELAVGRSADGRYEACLWETPTAAPWFFCSVSAPPNEGDEASLWLLGIPRPQEVPALLQRHADILTVGPAWHTLDLASGRLLGPEKIRRRFGRPDMGEHARLMDFPDANAHNTNALLASEALKAAWQKLSRHGWETYEPDYSFGRGEYDAGRWVEVRALPLYDGVGGTLMLHLQAYYVGDEDEVWTYDEKAERTTGLPTEYYGRAAYVLPLPGGARDIPTPEEAVSIMGTT